MNWKMVLEAGLAGPMGAEAMAAPVSTRGTWDTATNTITLPDGWTSGPNRTGPQIIQRPKLRTCDIPIGWRVVPAAPSPTPTPTPPVQSDMDDLVARHNAFRAANGRPPLTADPRLMASAGDYARDMLGRGVLSHYGADGSTPWDRMAAQGYAWSDASENIAQGQTTNGEVMTDWEQSPGHRQDILGPYVHIGVGRAGNYWCADFASPR